MKLSSTSIADPLFFTGTQRLFSFGVHVSRECFGDTVLHVGVYVVPGPTALLRWKLPKAALL
jgi:hypothetical protein